MGIVRMSENERWFEGESRVAISVVTALAMQNIIEGICSLYWLWSPFGKISKLRSRNYNDPG